MTTVITEWGPVEAVMLQQAFRMTNEAFAAKLGAATRTVAKWHANPGMRLTLEMQQALDTMLVVAAPDASQRFEALWRQAHGAAEEAHEFWDRRLAAATNLHRVIAWLDKQRETVDGTSSFGAVVASAAARASFPSADPFRLRPVVPDRARMADVVLDYYRPGFATIGPVQLARPSAEPLTTTMLAAPEWLTLADDLGRDRAHFAYDDATGPVALPYPSVGLLDAATSRLGDVLATGTRFVDENLYRLIGYAAAGTSLTATFSLGSFGQYAVTGDLLAAETAAVASGAPPERLPLRDELLPSVESVLAPASRLCVGGTLALSAFARPARGPRPADYLLLLQERGGQVLNAEHRLAVIPKCFHQPTSDLVEDVHVGTTLVRELEEELFGREEVDSTIPHPPIAEPLHLSRLSEPMRWLRDSPSSWVLEATGFAFNLLTGNFEIPALIAIHDEAFWQQQGGAVQANWESSRLIRVSSMDSNGLATLLVDPVWSDEGLLAFALGLQRLADLDGDRVNLPPFQTGVLR